MKKSIKLVSAIALAITVLFSSCGKKSEEAKPAPSISVTGGNVNGTSIPSFTAVKANPADKITLNYSASTGEELASINVTFAASGTTSTLSGYPKKTGFTSKTSNLGTVEYTVATAGTLSITVTDSKGATATHNLVITLKGAAITTSTATLLGAQSNSAPGFFASSTGTAYSSDNSTSNATTIDITYAELGTGTVKAYLLSAPQRATEGLTSGLGSTGTITYFKASTVTAANFDTYDDDTFASSLTVSKTDAQKVEVTANNTVYEFLNTAGKKGLIKVTTYAKGTTKPDGSITITTKVQK